MFQRKDQKSGDSTLKLEGSLGVVPEGEALYEANLIMVASQLTTTLVTVSSKKPECPEDIMETFSRMHALLEDWYSGAPKKRELKQMLDTMLPNIGFMGAPPKDGGY